MSHRSRIPALLAAGVLGLVPACSDSGSKPQDSTKTDAAGKRTPPTPSPFEPGASPDATKMPPGVPPVPQGPGSRPTEKLSDFPSFKVETTKPGSGPAIEFGQKGKFHYVGTFPNGKQFDSSVDRGEPSEFTLGAGVIKGWVLGLEGMKVGEKRRLIVPPELAYGKVGNGAVPADATLVFDVELVGLPDAPASMPSSAAGDAKK